jgi:hypothetical protein
MADQLEIGLPQQMGNIDPCSRVEIIQTQDIVTFLNQPVAKVRA